MYAIATQPDYPGWGCWVREGATTLWERWNGTASRNHSWSDRICAWMIRRLGGIRPQTPGFKEMSIALKPVGDLTHAEAEHISPYGTITSRWQRQDRHFELKVRIPPNTAATVELPGANARIISGDAERADGRFQCASGEYQLDCR